MMKDILTIHKPDAPGPLVFDSPHSGAIYPADFNFACPFDELQKAEDNFVAELFDCAPRHGGTLLEAHFPRSYIDVNRAADDIDPDLLDGEWPHDPIRPSARSDAGIGLIRRLVRPGMPVYDRALSAAEIRSRIETCYVPYHDALEKLIEDAHYRFGQVWHINCHSMPAISARPKQAIGLVGRQARASDFVLGDRDGTTCAPAFTRAIRDFLRGLGYTVTINDPFKGVELVRRYSSPARGRHSLQIEINKALYMDEDSGKKTSDFKVMRDNIEKLVEFISLYTQSQLIQLAAD